MQIQKITSFIDKLDTNLVLLLCHQNADPDAVFSAYAFSKLLKRLRPLLDVEIAAVQGPSKLSKILSRVIPVKLTEQPHIEEAGLTVLLDTNTTQQLDIWGERVRQSGSPLIVIDHHARHPETEAIAALCITDEEASSTCEIVYKFFKEAKIKLTELEAKALFLGIAFDTKHFILATSDTFKTVAELVNSGVNAREILPHLSLPIGISERAARLKACKRMEVKKVNGWLIVISHVSSYQASAARALIGLGAHVAVVGGKRRNVIKISLRSCHDFYEKTGIHLGRDIARPLGEHLQGSGGGHSTAAGVRGLGDTKIGLDYSLKLLNEKLKQLFFR